MSSRESIVSNTPKSAEDFICSLFTTSFLPEYIKKYATEEALKDQEEMSSSSESSISDFSEDEAQDMELWHENRQVFVL